MIRLAFSAGVLFAAGALATDCKPGSQKQQPPQPQPDPPPSVVPSATTPVPQAMPVADFDASLEPTEGKTPLEQAKIYESRGQLWMAQMVLEQKALGPDGTKSEAEELGYICYQRDDADCVKKCETKLGKKLKFDGGAPRLPALDDDDGLRTHKEPKSDVARARDLVLKKQYADARKILEPRVLDGKASREEIRLLKQVCKSQGDRMCVVLCDTKLK